MSRNHQVVLQLDSSMLRAVEVDVGGRRATVTRAMATRVPEGIADDYGALGVWAAEALGSGGFDRSSAIWTVGREAFALRTLEFPRATSAELPGMVRLAMQKESALESGGAVIDFLAGPRRTAPDGSPTVSVLAAGLPAATLERFRGWSSGLRGLVPRFLGAIEFADAAAGETVAVLDATGSGLECTIVRDGEVLWSRAGGSDAVASESKRMWLAFRLAEPSLAVSAAIVLGDEASVAAVGSAIAGVAGVPVRAAATANRFDSLRGVDPASLATCLSLVGLALRGASESCIDFANPRQAPDIAAARRRRGIIAAGVATLAVLGGWTLGNLERKSFLARVEDLEAKAKSALPEHQRFKRDSYRLRHLETWASVRPEWLDHALFLHRFAPDARLVVLDAWNGTLETSDVEYGRDRKWTVESQLKVTLDGEARDREVADAFRESLVEDRVYTLTSTGADGRGGRRLSSPFSYLLRTDRLDDPSAGIPAPGTGTGTGAKP